MLRRSLSAILMAFALTGGAYAAETVFPAEITDIDGITRSGYLGEDGETVLPFDYAVAGDFAECGLAAVENGRWQTAVIDRKGKTVINYVASPLTVDFSDNAVAYRYEEYSVYYTLDGVKTGSYTGAEGFFSDGLLLCRSPASGLYSYVLENGERAFEGEFIEAGAFYNGKALVKTPENVYLVIDTEGNVVYTLENGVQPVYMRVFGEDTLVVSDGTLEGLYSFSKGLSGTVFKYDSVSEFEGGAAMAKEGKLWGIIDVKGKYLTEPSYYYLSYMGEGLYAARSQDGSASAVDANGGLIYRTSSYAGGFDELRYGLAWHGTENGNLIFFRKNGGYLACLKNAENPKLLSEDVVKVTQDECTRYINIATGKVLYEQPKTFDLGEGLSVNTVHYERFFGFLDDGGEYGWDVDFPELSGLPDEEVQTKINDGIRSFFLSGPSVSAEYEALEGGYGASLEGSVLVVSANCISGKGAGSSVWNGSIAFDLRDGTQYQPQDLFEKNYIDTVKTLLPKEHEIYMYGFPRISIDGITYYYNEFESESRRAYTESYTLSFKELERVINKDSECYNALKTAYKRPEEPEPVPYVKDEPETEAEIKPGAGLETGTEAEPEEKEKQTVPEAVPETKNK